MAGRACALCGAPCRPPFQAPAPELAPDLDLRPGEPTRSTLDRWVATCRGCGASAPDLAALPAVLKDVVAGPAYRALGGAGPGRAALRWAFLCEAGGDPGDAAQAVLEAAWALDDAGQDALALRRRAAASWGEPATGQEALRLVDVLRRAQDFAGARVRAEALLARPGLDETDAAVMRFQLGLIAAGDGGRHLLSSALRPPARTPHVTHGQGMGAGTPPKGFWRRLTGG